LKKKNKKLIIYLIILVYFRKLSQKIPINNTPFIEIPPNTDLLYRIHLKSFVDVTDMSLMQPIERLSLA
jgi:hypothetical protein